MDAHRRLRPSIPSAAMRWRWPCVQSLYSQIEDLFIRQMKKRGLRVRRLGDWRPLLLQASTLDVPNGPRALLREHTYAALASMPARTPCPGQVSCAGRASFMSFYGANNIFIRV